MTNIRRTHKKLVRTLFILLAAYTVITMLQRFDFNFRFDMPVPRLGTAQADY
jgi:hypothetical protein